MLSVQCEGKMWRVSGSGTACANSGRVHGAGALGVCDRASVAGGSTRPSFTGPVRHLQRRASRCAVNCNYKQMGIGKRHNFPLEILQIAF